MRVVLAGCKTQGWQHEARWRRLDVAKRIERHLGGLGTWAIPELRRLLAAPSLRTDSDSALSFDVQEEVFDRVRRLPDST